MGVVRIPPPDARCRLCGDDLGGGRVQVEDPADDPDARAGWLCLPCFDSTLAPDDPGGMPWGERQGEGS